MRWLLAGIPLLILIGVLWLAFLDHDVEWTSKAFGTVLIYPRAAPPPPACKDVLAVISQTDTAIADAGQRLHELQDAAIQLDQKYQHPDYTRFWGETGHIQSEENWKRVHDREAEIKDNTNRLVGFSEAVRKSCAI